MWAEISSRVQSLDGAVAPNDGLALGTSDEIRICGCQRGSRYSQFHGFCAYRARELPRTKHQKQECDASGALETAFAGGPRSRNRHSRPNAYQPVTSIRKYSGPQKSITVRAAPGC